VGTHNHCLLLKLLGRRKRDDRNFPNGFKALIGT